MRRLGLIVSLLVAVAVPASALAHEERPAQYPPVNPRAHVPSLRSAGRVLVVCKRDSGRRIRARVHGGLRHRDLALLRRCRFRDIETAVLHARSRARILVLPGVYREQPSRRVPVDDPKCKDLHVMASDGDPVPSYEYQLRCPRSKNLITVAGDRNGDRRCDHLCSLQIVGMGARPSDVTIVGDRRKQNVIRADRADGFVLANIKILYGDINSVYVMETNGFRLERLITADARRYGVLSFTSDHGLYDRIDAFGNGDSGVYPGSGGPGDCQRYAIELRGVNSHDNVLGYSGTAGDNVWVHDSRFHDNATGLATDSFASGHPGMPQHCAKWEHNQIYSNNADLFNAQRIAYCKQTAYIKRDLTQPCPTFQVPVGTGAIIAGGNGDIVRNNLVWDNWRDGFKLLWVPAYFRGQPEKGIDTSFNNQFTDNRMGTTSRGTRAPNGNDFWWDGEGRGNCFAGNTGYGGAAVTHRSPLFPTTCPGSSLFLPGDATMTASQATCSTWDPETNPFPPGCDWFTQPRRPQ